MDDLEEAPDLSVPATSPDLISENAARLAEIFPEAVTEDGVNFEILKEILGEDLSEGGERYGLDWAGKSLARRIAAKPSAGTLRPDPEDSVEWDTTENLVIEGDNLEVLKLLQKPYAGKVKLIYIDPPYNTGKDFVYKDDYQDNITNYLRLTGQVDEEGSPLSSNVETSGRFHTEWLNMMYPRLKLAWELLREDGAIVVSIDDGESARLFSILEEVFGQGNFVATVVWQRAYAPVNLKKTFSPNHDYALVFARNLSQLGELGINRTDEANARYANPDNDPRGDWKSDNLSVGPPIEANIYEVKLPSGRTALPPSGYSWRYSASRLEELISDQRIWFGKSGDAVPSIKRFRSEVKDSITPMTIWPREEVDDSQFATKALRELFDNKVVFSYPKPVKYIRRFLEIVRDDDALILDFFAGSGTTGHAVMAQNAEDGGNRRFILVQLPEPLDPEAKEQRVAAEFCDELGKPRNIAELTKERLRRVADKVKEENPDFTGDTGFRVLRLDSSNVLAWDSETKDLEDSLEEQVNPIKDDRTEMDLLFEGLLKLGIDPTSPIEEREVEGARVMSVGEGRLVACLAEGLDREAAARVADEIVSWVSGLGTAEDVTCLFRDSSFVGDAAKAELIARLTQAEMAEKLRFF